MSQAWRIGLAVIVLLAVLAGGLLATQSTTEPRPAQAQAQTLRAGAYDPPRKAPEFALRGSDGRPVSLARFRGKVVLLSFGFTNCAAVCPTTLSTLARAHALLGEKADAVQVVFVTVDPERDTPAQMHAYLAGFDLSFIGATGDPAVLAAIRKDYGVTARKEGTGDDYAVAHTSSIFLIDPAGNLRAMMPFGREPEDFVHDVDLLLRA